MLEHQLAQIVGSIQATNQMLLHPPGNQWPTLPRKHRKRASMSQLEARSRNIDPQRLWQLFEDEGSPSFTSAATAVPISASPPAGEQPAKNQSPLEPADCDNLDDWLLPLTMN